MARCRSSKTSSNRRGGTASPGLGEGAGEIGRRGGPKKKVGTPVLSTSLISATHSPKPRQQKDRELEELKKRKLELKRLQEEKENRLQRIR